MNNDPVNHPPHYTTHPSKVECITITRNMSFNVGNAFKYLYRCDKKENVIQDIQKAKWYITDELTRREKLRFRFFAEDPLYNPRYDGSAEIRAILESEDRLSGHLCWALDRLYVAHVQPRSVESLKSALASCNRMLNFYA